jgi:hypothetical protein
MKASHQALWFRATQMELGMAFGHHKHLGKAPGPIATATLKFHMSFRPVTPFQPAPLGKAEKLLLPGSIVAIGEVSSNQDIWTAVAFQIGNLHPPPFPSSKLTKWSIKYISPHLTPCGVHRQQRIAGDRDARDVRSFLEGQECNEKGNTRGQNRCDSNAGRQNPSGRPSAARVPDRHTFCDPLSVRGG